MKIWYHLFVIALFGCLSFNIFYHHVSRGGIYDTGMADDVKRYLVMMNDVHPDSVNKQFRFRILHVKLAQLIPDFKRNEFQFTNQQQIMFKFGVISLIAITLCAWLLWWFLTHAGVQEFLSFVLVLLWITGFYLQSWIFQPLPDALSYLSIISCLFLWQQRQWVFLIPVFALALFAKETVVLVAVYQLIIPQTRKERITGYISLLPGLIIFFWYRSLYTNPSGDILTFKQFLLGMEHLFNPGKQAFYWTLSAWWAYQILWVPIAIGFYRLFKYPDEVTISRHILWLTPIILLFPFAIHAITIGRLWQLGFPVFLLLAAEGFRWMIFRFTGTEILFQKKASDH